MAGAIEQGEEDRGKRRKDQRVTRWRGPAGMLSRHLECAFDGVRKRYNFLATVAVHVGYDACLPVYFAGFHKRLPHVGRMTYFGRYASR